MGTVRVERCPKCHMLTGEGTMYEHQRRCTATVKCAQCDAPPPLRFKVLDDNNGATYYLCSPNCLTYWAERTD